MICFLKLTRWCIVRNCGLVACDNCVCQHLANSSDRSPLISVISTMSFFPIRKVCEMYGISLNFVLTKPYNLCTGCAVQTTEPSGGEATESSRPSPQFHRWPDGEILVLAIRRPGRGRRWLQYRHFVSCRLRRDESDTQRCGGGWWVHVRVYLWFKTVSGCRLYCDPSFPTFP